MSVKQILYYEAKELSRTLHIQAPKYIGSSAVSLRQFITINTRKPLPFLHQIQSFRRIPRDIIEIEYEGCSVEELRNQMVRGINHENHYITILDRNNRSIPLRRAPMINTTTTLHAFYDLVTMLDRILARCEEYNTHHDYLVVQIHRQISRNPRITNQRDGLINCACKAVLDHLERLKDSTKTRWLINNVKQINNKYFESGIDDVGLQELADKTAKTLVVKDSIGEVWREFKPIYKTKFNEYEIYTKCFTSAGVGKAKFIEQFPEYEYGCDRFHSLLMDADVSGFYCRTGESQNANTKYDQNSSYKHLEIVIYFRAFLSLKQFLQ